MLDEDEVDIEKPSTSRAVRHLPVRSWKSPDDWKIEAMLVFHFFSMFYRVFMPLFYRGLLELMWQTEDSVPFREPVNKHKYPTYYQVGVTKFYNICIYK